MLNNFPATAVCVNVCTWTQHFRGDKKKKKKPKRNTPPQSVPELPMLSTEQGSSHHSGPDLTLYGQCLLYCTNRHPQKHRCNLLLLQCCNFSCLREWAVSNVSPPSIFCWNMAHWEEMSTWAVHLWNKTQPPSHCEKRQTSQSRDYGISWKHKTSSLASSSTGMNKVSFYGRII